MMQISNDIPKVQASLKAKHSNYADVITQLQHRTGGDAELLAYMAEDPNTGLLGRAFAVAAMGEV